MGISVRPLKRLKGLTHKLKPRLANSLAKTNKIIQLHCSFHTQLPNVILESEPRSTGMVLVQGKMSDFVTQFYMSPCK